MTLVELEYLLQALRRRVDLVNSPVVLGRTTAGVGAMESLTMEALLTALSEGNVSTSLTDVDDAILQDIDGAALYDDDAVIENPIRATRVFNTVAAMLASDSQTWDNAITLNWTGTDGNIQHWTLVQDPAGTADDVTLALDDGGGFARTFSTKGPDAGDNFASVDEVTAAVAGARHTHHQATAAFSWDVFHSLGAKPAVTTTDSSGNEIIGDVSYVSNGHVVIAFGAASSGYAYLN